MRSAWFWRKRIIFPLVFLSSTAIGLARAGAQTDDCAANPTPLAHFDGGDGTPIFVAPGQTFHVNVEDITNHLSTDQAADIINGIREWSGVNGVNFIFDSSSPGSGVMTVQLGTQFNHLGWTKTLHTGAPGYAINQIDQIITTLDLNHFNSIYDYFDYDASAPNADLYLKSVGSHETGHGLGLGDSTNPYSIMAYGSGTNNQGGALKTYVPSNCDKQAVALQGARNSSVGGGGGTGGTGTGGSGGGDGSQPGACFTQPGYEEWDDSTNTLTYYYPNC